MLSAEKVKIRRLYSKWRSGDVVVLNSTDIPNTRNIRYISLRAYVCAQPFVLFSSYIIGVCNICFDSSFQFSVKTLLLSTKLVYELLAVFIIRRRSRSSKVSFAKDRSLQKWRKVDKNIFLEHTVAAYYSVRVLSLRLAGWRDLLPLILFVL